MAVAVADPPEQVDIEEVDLVAEDPAADWVAVVVLGPCSDLVQEVADSAEEATAV